MNSSRIGLNSNALKIIAAICMVIDHVGLLIFPTHRWMRIVGRIAFPIFAFMIAEGARYTRSKLKYFLHLFVVGVGCQLVYFFAMGSLDMCILIKFSLSLIMIYPLKQFKKSLFSSDAPIKKLLYFGLFVLSVGGVYLLTQYISVDYGFYGALAPVLASIPDMRDTDAPRGASRCDVAPLRVLMLAIGLLPLATNSIQKWAFLAIPFLLLYNGERGKLRLKYFFYIFYPVHLGLIYVIYYIIQLLS